MTLASPAIGIYQFPEFLPAAVACFSGREYDATKELSPFLEALGVRRGSFRTVDQVHGDKAVLVEASSDAKIEAADGLVTQERGLALVIRTADCVPVFFFDAGTPAVGICHSGWRGVKKGIIFRTLGLFKNHFFSPFKSMRVAMGPSICESCYEVGEEFQDYFPGLVKEKTGKYFFNLREAVKGQILQNGIPEASIFISKACTSCSVDRFFSARREGMETGRFLSVIMLK